MNEKSEKVILFADCQSFYASVEKADHPRINQLLWQVIQQRVDRVLF